MELWERSDALAHLDRILTRSNRSGRVAIIGGEAGIGKTACVTEFIRRAGSRANVAWGACDQLTTPRSLGPLRDILRDWRDVRIAATHTAAIRAAPITADRGTESQENLFTAFLEELSATSRRGRTTVIVVEDAHWADEATLDWLIFLSRRITRLCAMLLVTYRDDQVAADHPLRRALASMPVDSVDRVRLAPLSQQCVATLAEQVGRDPDLLYRAAGGNPLLVTEMLQSRGDGTSDAVQDLILERIRRLPESAREFARLISVVPTSAPAVFASSAPRDAQSCLDEGVLVSVSDGIAYRHELLRVAVEETLPAWHRVALHRRAYALLRASDDADPSRLVHHARGADDDEELLRVAPIAAAAAARQGAHREAARHYEAALPIADRLPDVEQAELLEAFADECYLAARHEDAYRARRRAVGIRERLDQPELVAADLRWLSRHAWWTGRVDEARASGTRAVRILESLPDGPTLARAYANQAQVHITTHELADARVWGERARAAGARHGDLAAELSGAVTVASIEFAEGDDLAEADLRAAHERAVAHGYLDEASRAIDNLAMIAGDERAQFARAESLCGEALAFDEQNDFDSMYLLVLAARAKVRLERGDWAGAVADAEITLKRAGRTGVASILALFVLGRVGSARGDDGVLRLLDDAAAAAAGVGDVPMVAQVGDARSEYFLRYGDAARARDEAAQAFEYCGGVDGLPFIAGRLAWRLHRAGGTVEPVGAAPFRAMIEGRWVDAAAAWAERGGMYLRAEALAEGDDDAARAALAMLDDWAAVRAAGELRSRLRARGMTVVPRGPRRTTGRSPLGLTERQTEVIALLSEGLTNGEIAARLSLSTKTVGHHVSAILAKLGVSRRAMAVVEARRVGIVD